LALSSEDDSFAPPASVRALLRFYPGASGELRLITARQLGLAEIEHFGYFREEIGARLWPSLAAWLACGEAA
jgi:predicted alpha/beta hydrolase